MEGGRRKWWEIEEMEGERMGGRRELIGLERAEDRIEEDRMEVRVEMEMQWKLA